MSGGGTYRTLATANLLDEAGFEVHVLTAEKSAYPGFTGVDDELVHAIAEGVTVHRIPFTNPRLDQDIRTWPAERVADPTGWREERARRGHVGFPETDFGTWFEPAVRAADELQRRLGFDLVMVSANPHVVMAVGDHLHVAHGVPSVIDHRDAWRLNCYSGDEQHVSDPRVAELETQYFTHASQIWFVNPQIRAWHQALYPACADRMKVVENGYDAAFAPRPTLTPPPPDRPLVFSFIGSIGPQVPVAEFVEGWVTARAHSPELAAARAEIYGPLPSTDQARTRMFAQARSHGITHHGRVAKHEVAGVYEGSDALLLLLGGGRYVTSGKVYEYLASALPIVSVHDPDSGVSKVLEDYPLWVPCADLSPDAVADALARAGELARTASPALRERAHAFALGAERHAQLREPITSLLRLVEHREDS